jgi:circadian clock protein KaiC
MAQDEVLTRISTGIAGLDEILHGGLVRERSYLVRGGPGTGKTTMGMHFLAAGAAAGEPVLWISLGEPETKLRQNGMAQGFDLQGVAFLDLSPNAEFFSEVETYDIFAPTDVDREPTTQKIIDKIKALKPKRVFVDSMTQFRYLSADAFQFRKQALSFLRFLSDHGATVLFTAEGSAEVPDNDLQFMCDGVLQLTFGPEGRALAVLKVRGADFRSGAHSIRLGAHGMTVFPKLIPKTQRSEYVSEPLSSGVPELDALLHGGLERGTISIITGPSGV